MSVTLLQSNVVTSSVAGPTTITPALSGASVQGTTLVLVVLCVGTSPVMPLNTLGGFIPAGSGDFVSNAFLMRVFVYSNNPGGVTGPGAIAVTAGGGGAVAAMFEFSGIGASNLDQSIASPNAGVSTSFNSLTGGSSIKVGELLFEAVGYAAATLTPTATNDWVGPVGTGVSTNGTPNAQLSCFYGVTQDGLKPSLTGTFNISVVNGQVVAAIAIQGTQQPTYTNVGGLSGQLVGQFFQGMIGG